MANPLIFLGLVVVLFTAPSLQAVSADLHDDLRVSSSTLNGGNYHRITPNKDAKLQQQPNEQLFNQIGKPLVAQITTNSPYMLRRSQPIQQQQLGNYSAGRSAAQFVRQQQPPVQQSYGPWMGQNVDQQQQQSDLIDTVQQDVSGTQHDKCEWMNMTEISEISFDLGDMIIRDAGEQPCYLLTIQAFLILENENGHIQYFPLKNFRPHPLGAHKIEFEQSDDKHASQRLILNCSPPLDEDEDSTSGSGTLTRASLVSQDRANRAFTEELTVQVDCGYLVLRLRGDGTILILDEISFFAYPEIESSNSDNNPYNSTSSEAHYMQTSGGISQRARSNAPEQRPRAGVAPPSMESKHLVFSSAKNNNNQDGGPLVVMPAYSRYVCRQRIVLAGSDTQNRTVLLVLNRFELKRLTNEPAEYKLQAERGAPMERDLFMDSRPRRDTHGPTIIYKSPMNAVTSCSSGTGSGGAGAAAPPQSPSQTLQLPTPPPPSTPTSRGQLQQQLQQQSPLTSMMDLSGLRRANDTMGTAMANRWIFAGALQKSSAAAGGGHRAPPSHFLDSIVLLGLGLAAASWSCSPGSTSAEGARWLRRRRWRPIWAGAGAIY